MLTDPRLGSGARDPGVVCRLSGYASRSAACVKYQEQLKQIEGVAAMGAKAGKCTLKCTDPETVGRGAGGG